MEYIIVDGQCPECELEGVKSNLHLNKGDYWECPKCKLQLQIVTEDYIKIVHERGTGELRRHVYKPEISGEKILIKQTTSHNEDFVIKNSEELKKYLKQIS